MPQHLFLSGTARAGTSAQVAREAGWAACKQLCALMPPPLQDTAEGGR